METKGTKNSIIAIIQEMMDDFSSLILEIEPVLARNEKVDLTMIQDHFNKHVIKIKSLSDKVSETYRLIQIVIDSIHSSRSELKKSVDGLIKKTGQQLQKVTSTTEEATNKILDVAEKLDMDQQNILKALDRLKTAENSEASHALIEEIKGMIYFNSDAAFQIIDYLQFQDITAQQIAGAYSLLSDTEKTLLYVSNSLKEFDALDQKAESILTQIDKNAFNADANFTDKASIQTAIDDLFSSGNTSIDIPTDDGVVLKDFVATKVEDKKEDEDFDIDDLFNTKPDKPATDPSSQDEIDKLFS